MRAGELRKRVLIQQRSTGQDTSGGQLTTWSDVATVWAAIEPMSGRELINAAAAQSEATHTVLLRYRPGIVPAMRINYQSRLFDIKAVLDENERHRMLTLICAEGLNNG